MFAASKSGAVQSAPKDAQFNYVTMLLHGDGTNGAQNNTFLDSSSNAFTITRNGNTTQGSFSPYGSNWSNYFGGSDGLSLASSSSLSPEAGDFCVEAWIFPQTTGGAYYTVYSGPAGGIYFGFLSAGGFGLRQRGGSDLISATSPSVNTWTHVAATRSGTSLRLFYNGVQQGSTVSNSTNFAVGAAGVGDIPETGLGWLGYISNCRFVKGAAVYTSNFTPSTSPLTAISGTQLLTCQSNRFVDNSGSSKTISVSVGTPSVQRFNPFGTSTAYSTATIGGSGYFDGSGDYIYSGTGAALNLSTGDYTIECWFYPTSLNASYTSCVQWNPSINNYLGTKTTNATWYDGSIELVGGTIRTNAWNHIAATRSGTSVKLFLNGAVVASGTSSASVGSSTDNVYINTNSGGSYQSGGYYSDVRITKGGALYTAAFTPPTSPMTTTVASGTVSLLTNFTNGAIYDNAMMNDLETVGNAQISTSVKKYGTGSLAFDGTGDYLITPYSPLNTMSTNGSFTVECWIYPTNLSGSFMAVINNWISPYQWWFGLNGNKLVIDFNNNTIYAEGSTSLSTNTWYHVAWVYTASDTTGKVYLNGVLDATVTSVTIPALASAPIAVGVNASSTGIQHFQGYIDDLRITKGYARYTTTFTPPTAAFPNIGPN